MQTPAAIGAAVAMKKVFETTDTPFTITIYGIPAEETFGGKITMAENGCFREQDIALATHATSAEAFVGGISMALKSFAVTFKGKSAHAAGSAYNGRSAADAMFLSFNGIEFMREHVKDGTHSQEWVDAGKTEAARTCLMNSAKVMAGMMYDLVLDPTLVEKASAYFQQ